MQNVSLQQAYINLKLLAINSIVLTGGITKVLTVEEIEAIIAFFYRKILSSDHNPSPFWTATTISGRLAQRCNSMSINCIRALLEDAVQSHSDKTALLFNGRA